MRERSGNRLRCQEDEAWADLHSLCPSVSAWTNSLLRFEAEAEESLRAARAILELNPGDPGAWWLSARALVRLGKREEAVRALATCLELQPGSAQVWALRGLASLPDVHVALDSLRTAARLDSRSALLWHGRAVFALAAGRTEEALASLDRVVQLNTQCAAAWCHRGSVLLSVYREKKALLSFDKATALQPTSAEPWYGRGRALYGLKRFGDAVTSLDKAVDLNPRYSQAWVLRGDALAALAMHEAAVESFAKASSPGSAEGMGARLKQANLLSTIGRREDAVALYDEVLKQEPLLGVIWHRRGVLLMELQRYEDALTSFDKAIPAEPSRTLSTGGAYVPGVGLDALFRCRALALSALDRSQEALDALDASLRVRQEADVWTLRGNVLAGRGQATEALESFEQAVRLDPKSADGFRGLGKVLMDLGRERASLRAFEKALRLNWRDAESLSCYGSALLQLGRHREAARYLSDAVKYDAKRASAWVALGTALLQGRRLSSALASFETAVQLDPTSASAWSGQGSALRKLGRNTEAETSIARALTLGFVGEVADNGSQEDLNPSRKSVATLAALAFGLCAVGASLLGATSSTWVRDGVLTLGIPVVLAALRILQRNAPSFLFVIACSVTALASIAALALGWWSGVPLLLGAVLSSVALLVLEK